MSLLDVFNSRGDDDQYPGMYSQPRQGGGMPFEQGLSNISPLLGMMGSAFQLDKNIMQLLAGPGFARYGGSFDAPTNQANVFLNAQQTAMNQRTLEDVSTVASNYQQKFLTRTYESMGFSADTATAKAKNATDSYFNPMGLISEAMLGEHQFEAARIEMQKTSMAVGLQDTNSIINPMGRMSPAQLKKMGYDATTEAALLSKEGQFKRLNKEFMTSYADDPFSFGGLNAGESGQVMSWMSKNGGINKNTLAEENLRNMDGPNGTAGSAKSGASKVVDRVKEMSGAVSVMQEIFGGSIPELLQKMDAMFAGQAGGMDPATIKSRMLQFKHTAAVTGTSLETMGNMIGVSQQYLGALGADQSMGFGVTLNTAQLMGSTTGETGNRVNAEQYRSDTLKMRTGAAASERAKQASSAYLIWLDSKKGRKDDADTRIEFEERVKKYGADLGGLAQAAGASASQVLLGGEAERVKNFQADNPMFGGEMAFAAKMQNVGALRAVRLRNALGKYGVIGAGEDINTLDQKTIIARLEAKGLSAGEFGEAAGAVGNIFTSSARQMGFQGARAGASFDELQQDRKEQNFNAGQVLSRANLDATMKEKFSGRFGMRGLMEAIANGDKDLGSLVASSIGLEKKLSTEDATGVLSSLKGFITKEGDSPRGKAMERMQNELVDTLRSGKALTKEDKASMQKIFSGKLGEEELFTEMQNVYESTSVEGRKVKTVREAGLSDEFYKQENNAGREKVLHKAALKTAAKDALTIKEKDGKVNSSGYTEAIDKIVGGEGAVADKMELLKKAGLSEGQLGDIEKKFKENEDKLGVGAKGGIEGVLEKLVTAIENFTNATNDKKGTPPVAGAPNK